MGAHNVDKVRLSPSRCLQSPLATPNAFASAQLLRSAFYRGRDSRSVPSNPSLTHLDPIPFHDVAA